MVGLVVEQDKLIFGVPGRAKHFSRFIEVPFGHVTATEIDFAFAASFQRKLEFLAEFVPSAKREGAYYEDQNCLFWEVTDPRQTIVITLRNEAYEKIILGVENPSLILETIENALKNTNPSAESELEAETSEMETSQNRLR